MDRALLCILLICPVICSAAEPEPISSQHVPDQGDSPPRRFPKGGETSQTVYDKDHPPPSISIRANLTLTNRHAVAGSSSESPQARSSTTAESLAPVPASSSTAAESTASPRPTSTSSTLGKTVFVESSKSAAVLALCFVIVSLIGYLGLLVWRAILARKYGNREILINETDSYDVRDLKHFEL